ncbi:MAG: hypothetical protein LIP01_09090 [Tannerellaceae bacterium]|nr:hypothetical protein [Tannerellaceae bacterium]
MRASYKPPVSKYRQKLHRIFVDSLGDAVKHSWDLEYRPFFVEVTRPIETTLEVYMFPALNPPGGRCAHEYKINILLQGHKPRTKMNFPVNDNYPILVAYVDGLDVFVLLDAYSHKDFTPNTNVQFKDDVILGAMEQGIACMTKLNNEVVIASTASLLPKALELRLLDIKPNYEIPY